MFTLALEENKLDEGWNWLYCSKQRTLHKNMFSKFYNYQELKILAHLIIIEPLYMINDFHDNTIHGIVFCKEKVMKKWIIERNIEANGVTPKIIIRKLKACIVEVQSGGQVAIKYLTMHHLLSCLQTIFTTPWWLASKQWIIHFWSGSISFITWTILLPSFHMPWI